MIRAFLAEKIHRLLRIVSSRLADGQSQNACPAVAITPCRLGPKADRSWRDISCTRSSIVNFSAANLIGGVVFGAIGFVAFIYGKRMNLWKPMLIGIALMVYPYFVSDDKIMIVIGLFGSTALFFVRE